MYIADLHIHSRYSRATSRDCTPEALDMWARRKGIHIVGTGDFTHPVWREELKEKLQPAEEGLYTLKKEYRIEDSTVSDKIEPRFVITGEISSIYKKNGRVRKVHSLVLLPGLEDAEIVSRKLEAIGNIHSDGRPILGLDCKDLLEILLELSPDSIYVPAHIWTPHFSLFGAFSGFDTVEECYEDLSGHIHAIETGLSSDPPMNWRVSALDRFQLISNSDAHSPAKLGREANLLDIELSYQGLKDAIQTGKGLYGTIEFFPEEGKYHYDGHRKCNLCLRPAETEGYGGICPVCGRKITIGVSHRVEQLADRGEGYVRADAKVFESLVPLPEVIAASVGHSAASAKVQKEYMKLVSGLATEFEILREVPLPDIEKASGRLVAEGIGRLREGKVERIPGFDGEYGTIRLFEPWEIEDTDGQMNLFDLSCSGFGQIKPEEKKAEEKKEEEKPAAWSREEVSIPDSASRKTECPAPEPQLNEAQREAVEAADRTIAVIAGPGTGKTKTLVSHLLYLLETRKVKPSEITAVTFTNQAAGELKERVQARLGKKRQLKQMQIGTFHSLCLHFLKNSGREFSLLDETEALKRARELTAEFGLKMAPGKLLEQVSRIKTGQKADEEVDVRIKYAAEEYRRWQKSQNLLDFDDLLLETLFFMEEGAERKEFSYLLVDEFQDISPLQYQQIQEWNQGGRELFVIGDPDQSIYGFRGADAGCFDRLKENAPDMRKIVLTENYRCTDPVLSLAVEVISKNPGGKRRLLAVKQEGVPVRAVSAGTEMGEAIFIAKEINRLTGGIGMLDAQEYAREEKPIWSFDDIAILYRTHRQAELLEKCLKKEGIPYITAGRESFLMEDTVRGSICFFRYMADETDIYARNVSRKLLWHLEDSVISDQIFEETAEKFRRLYGKKKPQKFLEAWVEEMNLCEDAAMNQLLETAVVYRTMEEFQEALTLGVESDLKRCGGKNYAAGAVKLMTLHGAKGLEFPVVFLYGVRKGLIPLENEKHPADPEEERRLFFVGMTRAKEELILTVSGEESGFLSELPGEKYVREKADKRRQAEAGRQLSLFDFL